ncbi:MAG: tetratricopeptide repeat protein, partial [Planctomycetota bacterium]
RMYAARISMVEGDMPESIRLLSEATRELPELSEAWRLLGASQLEAGLVADSVESFGRAFQGEPLNLQTAMAFARALESSGRGREALEILRPEERVMRNAPISAYLSYLRYEENYGDRELALTRRLEFLERLPVGSPFYLPNLEAVVTNLAGGGRFEDAAELIDEAGAGGLIGQFDLIRLRAQLKIAQGDTEAAVEELEAAITDTPEADRTHQMYQVLANVYSSLGDVESVVRTLREGHPYQTEEGREIDVALGNFQSRLGAALLNKADEIEEYGEIEQAEARRAEAIASYSEAAESFGSLVDAGLDASAELPLTKRYAELLVYAEEFDKAGAVLSGLSQQLPEDQVVFMLRAELDRRRGDVNTAIDLMNQAVLLNDSNPRVFLMRAELFGELGSRVEDRIADLERALELNSASIETWSRYADSFIELDRMNELVTKIQTALSVDQANVPLRQLLIQVLNSQPGYQDSAIAEAVALSEADPENIRWIEMVGNLNFSAERYAEAARWYKRLYEREESEFNAANYLNTGLLAGDRFSRAEIRRMLQRVEEYRPQTHRFKLLRARGHIQLEEFQQATELIQESFEEVEGTPFLEQTWFNDLRLQFGDAPQRLIAIIEELMTEDEQPVLIRLSVLQEKLAANELTASDVLEAMAGLADQAMDHPLERVAFHRLEHSVHYLAGSYQDSVDAGLKVLEQSRSDSEINNNVAYILAVYLGKPEEALPYAERAVKLQSDDSSVQDTYGKVLLDLDRPEEALQALDQAYRLAGRPGQQYIALLHRGQAQAVLGDLSSARLSLRQAESLAPRISEAEIDEYAPALQDLREALGDS